MEFLWTCPFCVSSESKPPSSWNGWLANMYRNFSSIISNILKQGRNINYLHLPSFFLCLLAKMIGWAYLQSQSPQLLPSLINRDACSNISYLRFSQYSAQPGRKVPYFIFIMPMCSMGIACFVCFKYAILVAHL